MNADEIRSALENARGIPQQALREAVAHAAELAPSVIAVAQRMADGCLPLPHEERLLRYGLHALAAARETTACPVFLALLRRPPLELDWLFGEDQVIAVCQLLLSLFDGNDAAVCALAADVDADEQVRSGLLTALARLVWQGSASRQNLLDLLDRLDREALAPPDSFVWIGWQDAIMLLGLTDWIERVQHGWKAGRGGKYFYDVDRKDWIERTRKAAADPDDPQRFADDSVVPIDDPAKSANWTAAGDSRPGEAPSADELNWLGIALRRSFPANDISLEEADGFLTALAAGPVRVPPAEYLPRILRADGETADLDTPRHHALAVDLLTRHHDAIERDLAAGIPPIPWLEATSGHFRAVQWAIGYVEGVELRKAEWARLADNKRIAERLLMPVFSLLARHKSGQAGSALPLRDRLLLIGALPEVVLATRRFWDGGTHSLLEGPSGRRPKVGRNDPCPCGSGKKYKRCCGAAA